MEIIDKERDEELVEVYTMYITRKGVRIYRPDGRPWHFWAKPRNA